MEDLTAKKKQEEPPDRKRARIRLEAMYLLYTMGWSPKKIAMAYKIPAYAVRAVICEFEGRSKASVLK